MRYRLRIAFLLVVLLPLAVLGWAGVRLARAEREALRVRIQEAILTRLADVDQDIAQVLSARERELLSVAPISGDTPESLRERSRDSAVCRQFFVLDADGNLVYPALDNTMTDQERAFVDRTRPIWQDRAIPGPEPETQPQPQQLATQNFIAPGGQKGWYVWHWGSGVNIILWWREDTGNVAGAELNPARLTADIIAALPETDPGQTTVRDGRIVLRDIKGDTLYQWGFYEPPSGEPPLATLALRPPLSMWNLAYYAPQSAEEDLGGKSVAFNIGTALASLIVATVMMAVYYYRENAREFREATQRIHFVNHVSHELKTPLTNIRMYAELLEKELGTSNGPASRYLDIIGSESRRLSRLIANVLTFSRSQRSALRLHTAPGDPAEALRHTVEQFSETLGAKGIETTLRVQDGVEVVFDRDVLEQIVGNLLSNVEKYAVGAKRVDIEGEWNEDTLRIVVCDDGPGIPSGERASIFTPFYRISNKLTDGVAGTGIGLTIARDLARLHGGDVTIVPAERGACFRVELHAPSAGKEETA